MRSLPLLMLLPGIALGCPPADDTSVDEAPTAAESTPAEPATESVTRGGESLAIDLQTEGLSPLYKGFFRHAPFVAQLAEDLGPHVRSRSATVKVVWDEPTVTGTVQLLVPDGEEPLAAVGRSLARDERIDAAPLQPYVAALDAYRQSVGERYDLRVLSFGIALELWDPRSECRCLWAIVAGDAAQGDSPVLGPTITCRDPFGKAYDLTADGDSWPAEIRGHKKGKKALSGALGQ